MKEQETNYFMGKCLEIGKELIDHWHEKKLEQMRVARASSALGRLYNE